MSSGPVAPEVARGPPRPEKPGAATFLWSRRASWEAVRMEVHSGWANGNTTPVRRRPSWDPLEAGPWGAGGIYGPGQSVRQTAVMAGASATDPPWAAWLVGDVGGRLPGPLALLQTELAEARAWPLRVLLLCGLRRATQPL